MQIRPLKAPQDVKDVLGHSNEKLGIQVHQIQITLQDTLQNPSIQNTEYLLTT